MLLDSNDMANFLKEAVYGVLCEISNALNKNYIYHFTDFSSALKIMKSDEMFLSRTTPSSVDLDLSDQKLTYLSFTRDGNIQTSQYPTQINSQATTTKINVRFVVDKEVIKTIGTLKDVDFHMQKARDIIKLKNRGVENTVPYQKKLNFFKKYGLKDDFTDEELLDLAKSLGTEESRFMNDKSSIKDFSNYVVNVDFLINPFYYSNFDILGASRMLSTLTKWKNKIRIFTDANDFDERENFQSIEDVLSGKEEKLTKEEEKELMRISDNYMNEKTLIAISKLFYVIAYSSKGFEYTLKNAKRILTNLFGNSTIRITASRGKAYGESTILKDAILDCFDSIGHDLNFDSVNTIFVDTKNIFVQLSQNLATCRFVLAKVIDAYSDWLKKYKNSVDRKARELYNELNTFSLNNIAQIVNFASKNIYIFELICKKYLPKETDLLTSYLNAMTEGRRPKPRMSLIQLINELLKIIGIENLKKELESTYMNNKYHYDELIYFKRSVMLYKNNFITKVRKDIGSTYSRVGDLAVLYNNAEKASDENDL